MKFDSNMIIGNRIKFYRGSKGLKQEELAEKVSISNTQMSNLECGKSNLSYKTMQRLCEELEICPCALLTGALKTSVPENIIDLIKHLSQKEQEPLYNLLLAYYDSNKI